MHRTTPRLLLRPATVTLAETELTSLTAFAGLLGAAVPPGWPPGEYDRSAQEYFLRLLRQNGEPFPGWYSWYAIALAPKVLVGAGGFLGPPDNEGSVEIGFSVHPDWAGQGFATEMVRELVAFAFEHPEVRRIVGNTTRSNTGACRVFEHAGFSPDHQFAQAPELRYVLARDLA